MPIFNQIKNFLRHGRTSSGASDGLSSKEVEKYEAVARLVEQESLAKKKLPEYEGLEEYKLVDKLGDGAFSNVYKAVHTETGETVAIKVVRKYELKPQQRASVLKEVQIMRTIKHPNVVELLRFIETKGHYFLVLELCEGGELFHQIVRLTYFSEDLARHCIKQVASAVQYLHEERGVVHRDIKPENLLFLPIPFKERTSTPPPLQPGDEDKADEGEFVPGVGGGGIGCVKLADFGLSKVVWDEQTKTPCGTVGYTAPEIVKDERYSKSVDMWALGCVLYTLLCGFPPFYDESIQMLTEKVARGHFTFLSPWWDPISDEAKDLIKNLLCIDPEERFTISQFMRHPWITQASPLQSPKSSAKKHLLPIANRNDQLQPSLDSPTRGRRDIFSGVTSMKEVLDVSCAVHRMAEERAYKKDFRRRDRQGQTKLALDNYHMFDSESEEDDVDIDTDDDRDHDDSRANGPTPLRSGVRDQTSDVEKIRAALARAKIGHGSPGSVLNQLQRDRVGQNYRQQQKLAESAEVEPRTKSPRRANKHVFELNMENATLIGRRKHNQA